MRIGGLVLGVFFDYISGGGVFLKEGLDKEYFVGLDFGLIYSPFGHGFFISLYWFKAGDYDLQNAIYSPISSFWNISIEFRRVQDGFGLFDGLCCRGVGW